MSETEIEVADDGGSLDEPRGPHVPDAAGRLPWLGWVFVLLAVGDLALFVRDASLATNPSIADLVVYVLRVIPALVSILLPAALLARHPDATRRARTLLFGTILFAAVQGLQVLSDPLQPIFETLTPASADLPGLVPLAAMYDALIGLVAAFGLAYIALGLTQARRYVDRPGDPTWLFVPVATVLAAIAGVLTVSGLDLSGITMSPALAVYLGSSVVLGVLRVAVWAYLAAVATRGWRAGEDPIAGWRLAALAGGLILIVLTLVNLTGLLNVQNDTFVTIYGYAVASVYAAGHLCLLAAFAVGLPVLDPVDDDDPDASDDADEADEAVLDEDGWPLDR